MCTLLYQLSYKANQTLFYGFSVAATWCFQFVTLTIATNFTGSQVSLYLQEISSGRLHNEYSAIRWVAIPPANLSYCFLYSKEVISSLLLRPGCPWPRRLILVQIFRSFNPSIHVFHSYLSISWLGPSARSHRVNCGFGGPHLSVFQRTVVEMIYGLLVSKYSPIYQSQKLNSNRQHQHYMCCCSTIELFRHVDVIRKLLFPITHGLPDRRSTFKFAAVHIVTMSDIITTQ